MKKISQKDNSAVRLQSFLKDLKALSALPTSPKNKAITLVEHPFDAQLLQQSSLYNQSRRAYLKLGGVFSPRLCSTMRSLSAHDLFRDEIDYSPVATEMLWFRDHAHEVSDPQDEITALMRFNDISLFHEQNHRVIWRLLPPPPREQAEFRRYLNFAESLVVCLDVAMGDELGKKLSDVFERFNLVYRPAANDKWHKAKSQDYRKYLLAVFYATYLLLELVNTEDILNAVNYVFPEQKNINKQAVQRSLELNEHFTRITNPQWQTLNWQESLRKLKKMHAQNQQEVFYIAEDVLDFNEEFFYVRRVFDFYGV